MELSEMMKEFVQLKAEIKERKLKQEGLRTDILIDIKTKEIDAYEDDNVRLRFTTQKRKSFNKEQALEKLTEHGEDPNAFFTETDYETLKIDSKNKGGE